MRRITTMNDELASLNVEVSVAGRMMTRRIARPVKPLFTSGTSPGRRRPHSAVRRARDDLPEGVYATNSLKWINDPATLSPPAASQPKTQTGELSIHCTEAASADQSPCARCRINSTACRISPLSPALSGSDRQRSRELRVTYFPYPFADPRRHHASVHGCSRLYGSRNPDDAGDPVRRASACPFITITTRWIWICTCYRAGTVSRNVWWLAASERVFEINRNFVTKGISRTP